MFAPARWASTAESKTPSVKPQATARGHLYCPWCVGVLSLLIVPFRGIGQSPSTGFKKQDLTKELLYAIMSMARKSAAMP